MPKASSASLTVIHGELKAYRPDPPDELNQDESRIWKRIVDRMPADWFPPETHPMLIQLCRLAYQSHNVSIMIGKALEEEDDDGTPPKKTGRPGRPKKNKIKRYDYFKLVRIQMQLSDSINKLSTKMRLSQQSTVDASKTKGKKDREEEISKNLWSNND